MNYGYNPTPTYFSNYPYAPLQGPAAAYAPAVLTPQQMPSVTPNVAAATPVSSSNIQWVQGREAALAYPVAPGNTVILMDSDNPVVYKKSTDEHGKPLPMDIYDLHKRESKDTTAPSTPKFDTSEFVKKADLETFIMERIDRELDKRVSNLSFKPATKKKRTDEDDEE